MPTSFSSSGPGIREIVGTLVQRRSRGVSPGSKGHLPPGRRFPCTRLADFRSDSSSEERSGSRARLGRRPRRPYPHTWHQRRTAAGASRPCSRLAVIPARSVLHRDTGGGLRSADALHLWDGLASPRWTTSPTPTSWITRPRPHPGSPDTLPVGPLGRTYGTSAPQSRAAVGYSARPSKNAETSGPVTTRRGACSCRPPEPRRRRCKPPGRCRRPSVAAGHAPSSARRQRRGLGPH